MTDPSTLRGRRYIAVVQDARGYQSSAAVAAGAPLDKAPPDGPVPPTIHTVVKADDYGALEAALENVHGLLQEGKVEDAIQVALNALGGPGSDHA